MYYKIRGSPRDEGSTAWYYQISDTVGIKVLKYQNNALSEAFAEFDNLKAAHEAGIGPKPHGITKVGMGDGIYYGVLVTHINGKYFISNNRNFSRFYRAMKALKNIAKRFGIEISDEYTGGNVLVTNKPTRVVMVDCGFNYNTYEYNILRNYFGEINRTEYANLSRREIDLLVNMVNRQ